jgi:hypothetical protein
MTSRRLLLLSAFLLFSGSLSIGRAQDSSATNSSLPPVSLGEVARKARAEKKDLNKPAKVFTNEDMGSLKGTISVIGSEPVGSSRTGEKTDDTKTTNGATVKDTKDVKDTKKDSGGEAYWRAKFAAARKALADDSKELDILQRELNLKQEQYSQDPNWALHEQNTRADINKTRSEIDAKKQDVEKDKQAISDLEDELRKAGGDAGWAIEPSGAGSSDSGSGSSTTGSGSSNRAAQAPLGSS